MVHRLVAVLVCVVILTTPAWCKHAIVDVDVALEIEDEGGGSRVLLKCSDLEFLEDRRVVYAIVEIRLPSEASASRDLRLELYAASRTWSRVDVSWTNPWTVPGGEWSRDAMGSAHAASGRAGGTLRFDVSGILREIAAGREANCGFILMPTSGGRRFQGNDRALWEALGAAKLIVNHQRMPAGLRDGS
jgi:hypothetical protein